MKKLARVFFIFSLFSVVVLSFAAINEQEATEGETGEYKYLYLIQEGAEKLFEITNITTVKIGTENRIRVYITFNSDSSKSAVFSYFENGEITGEIQEKDTGEGEQISVSFRKRCKCSDTSYQGVNYDDACPSDCNKGTEYYFELKGITPDEELGIGIGQDYLILIAYK